MVHSTSTLSSRRTGRALTSPPLHQLILPSFTHTISPYRALQRSYVFFGPHLLKFGSYPQQTHTRLSPTTILYGVRLQLGHGGQTLFILGIDSGDCLQLWIDFWRRSSTRLEGPQTNGISDGAGRSLVVKVIRRGFGRRPGKAVFAFTFGPATTPLESLRRAWDDSRGAWDYVEECGWLRSHTPVVGEFHEGSKRSVMTNADGVLLF